MRTTRKRSLLPPKTRPPAGEPALDRAVVERAMRVVARQLPISEGQARAVLSQEGVLDRPIALAALADAAARVGCEPSFRLIRVGGARLAVGRSQVTAALAAYAVASRDVRSWGMATVQSVTDQLQVRVPFRVGPAFVERVLAATSAFEWLDQQAGWFWFTRRPNRLLDSLSQVFAVAPRISLGRLWAALVRSWKAPEAPPPSVLPRICAALPGVRVNGDLAIATRARSRVRLGFVERWVVSTLRRSPRPLALEELRRRAREARLPAKSLNRVLSTSALVESLPGSLFALVREHESNVDAGPAPAAAAPPTSPSPSPPTSPSPSSLAPAVQSGGLAFFASSTK